MHIDLPLLEQINHLYDGITIATLRTHSLVSQRRDGGAGQGGAFWRASRPPSAILKASARGSASCICARCCKSASALIVTGTPATRERLLRSFHEPVRRRIEGLGKLPAGTRLCPSPRGGYRRRNQPTGGGGHDSSGRNLGHHRSAGCRANCLDSRGRQPQRAWRAGRPGHFADAGLPGRNAGGWRAGLRQIPQDQCHRLDPAAPAQRRTPDPPPTWCLWGMAAC